MTLSHYSHQISETLDKAEASSGGHPIPFGQALSLILELMSTTKNQTNKVILIGNGGSAAIASHIATDLWKRASIRATAFSDASMITCVSNDFSYAEVFSKPIERFADEHDLLIAISSSGTSPNIINGVEEAKRQGCKTVTLSGFSPENKLRQVGDLNLYLPSSEYGWVEIGHTIILHYLCDKFLSISQKMTSQTPSRKGTL